MPCELRMVLGASRSKACLSVGGRVCECLTRGGQQFEQFTKNVIRCAWVWHCCVTESHAYDFVIKKGVLFVLDPVFWNGWRNAKEKNDPLWHGTMTWNSDVSVHTWSCIGTHTRLCVRCLWLPWATTGRVQELWQTVWPTELGIFTTWPFTENVCRPLLWPKDFSFLPTSFQSLSKCTHNLHSWTHICTIPPYPRSHLPWSQFHVVWKY